MTDLRKAAEMALDYIRREGWINPQGKEVFIALSQALAQPEQDTQTYFDGIPETKYTAPVDAVNMNQERVDETEKREHEPVAYKEECWACGSEDCVCAKRASNYIASPKREWVGLTDEEVEEIDRWVDFKEEGNGRIPTAKLVRYIETKLNEKTRTWVGLSTEEFKFIASKYLLSREAGLEYFQEEIEAKLKEKNGG